MEKKNPHIIALILGLLIIATIFSMAYFDSQEKTTYTKEDVTALFDHINRCGTKDIVEKSFEKIEDSHAATDCYAAEMLGNKGKVEVFYMGEAGSSQISSIKYEYVYPKEYLINGKPTEEMEQEAREWFETILHCYEDQCSVPKTLLRKSADWFVFETMEGDYVTISMNKSGENPYTIWMDYQNVDKHLENA